MMSSGSLNNPVKQEGHVLGEKMKDCVSRSGAQKGMEERKTANLQNT